MEPLKHLSQNFLVDQEVIQYFLQRAQLQASDLVLEIGPGKGAITRPILERGVKLIAVEKDRRLIPFLNHEFGSQEIVEGDFLNYDLEKLPRPVRVLSNLPFHLTAPILSKCIQSSNVIDLHVIVQDEMARRICGSAGTKEMSLLTLSMQNSAHVEYLFTISKNAFNPTPRVECAAIRLIPKKPLVPLDECDAFFAFLHIPYQQRRKMIRATLKNWRCLEECAFKLGISVTQRPEELTLEQWWQLYQAIKSHG